jgi:AcrR family transcriptional regulator
MIPTGRFLLNCWTMQTRSQKTRSRILQAALICISKSGFEAASVADICREAEVSKGAFYHHFPTKQAVFFALLNSWLESLDEQMSLARQGARDAPGALIEMARLMEGVFRQASQNLPLFMEIWTRAIRDPAVRSTLIAPYQRYQAYFQALLQQGIDEGSFRNLEADPASRALLSLAVGLLLQSLLDPSPTDWAGVTQTGIRIFVDGLRGCIHE